MTTSGTIGKTIVSTDVLVEHALRRCGKQASEQTAETIDIAKSCLYIMLAHYANNGLNLWCVERRLLGFQALKKDYQLPVGTVEVLNLSQATPVLASGILTANAITLDRSAQITRVGVKFSVLPTANFDISTSSNGVDFLVQSTVDIDYLEVDSITETYWFEFDPLITCTNVSVSAGTVEKLLCATTVSEIEIVQDNRDTYASLPNKSQTSMTVTSYMFSKTLAPFLTIWPLQADDSRHMAMNLHRQIQDVGRLTQKLAIPERWYEATIIQLAFRLAMELPKVDAARITLLAQLAQQFTLSAGYQETDSSTTYMVPDIGCYSA